MPFFSPSAAAASAVSAPCTEKVAATSGISSARDAVVIQHDVGDPALGEIPHDPLREPRGGRAGISPVMRRAM